MDNPKQLSPSPAHLLVVDRHLRDFRSHFAELSSYLVDYLARAAPNSRSTARSKLTRLTIQQFHELSTDVYDELVRRKNENQVPFLPVKEELHPKRNQARQKLATLPTSRFEDLSSDVHYEMARRYPGLLRYTSNKESLPSDNFQAHILHATDTLDIPAVDRPLPPTPAAGAIRLTAATTSDYYLQALKTHSEEFASYLGACGYSARDVSLPPQQGTSRSTNQQFYEMSTDTYDELIRRKKRQVPFLTWDEGYSPERNRSRQKLGELSELCLQDLVNDIQNDIILRRYPQAKQDTGNEPSPTQDNYQVVDFLTTEYPEILGAECDTERTAAQVESV